MSIRAFEYLINDPGGWPRGIPTSEFQVALEKSRQERVNEIKGSPVRRACAILCLVGFLVFPFFYGTGFAWRFHSLWLIAVSFGVMMPALRNCLLRGVPAKTACAWPMNTKQDRFRRYFDTMTTVTYVWLTSAAVFFQSVQTMRYGLGEDWNPFTRAIRITKGGPYAEYGFIELVMFVSGFFAISGLIWWPMYLFFERLVAKKPLAEQGSRAGA